MGEGGGGGEGSEGRTDRFSGKGELRGEEGPKRVECEREDNHPRRGRHRDIGIAYIDEDWAERAFFSYDSHVWIRGAGDGSVLNISICAYTYVLSTRVIAR